MAVNLKYLKTVNMTILNLITKNQTLRPYQIDGVKTLVPKKRFLLADDAGLGKTVQAIVAANYKSYKESRSLDVLVIGTKSMRITWHREVTKWNNENNYAITNFEQLIGKNAKSFAKKWDIVILDESHLCVKNVTSKRCKAFLDLIKSVDTVWLMTATAASKTAEDYYVTLKVLLPTLFKNWTKTHFIKKFCNEVADRWSYSGKKYEGFKNINELNAIFKKCSLKRKKADVAKDLPEITHSSRFAEVNPKDLMHLSEEDFYDIKSQVLAGVPLKQEYQAILRHNALLKIPSLIELLSTYPEDEKLVIFAWHQDVIDKIEEQIKDTGRTVAQITGKISSENKRQELMDAFQEGKLNTLVLNMQSGGVGITLTSAATAIYVQFPTVVTLWTQSLNRVHRIGSKRPVEIIKLMIEKSIDERVFKVLESRLDDVEKVGV